MVYIGMNNSVVQNDSSYDKFDLNVIDFWTKHNRTESKEKDIFKTHPKRWLQNMHTIIYKHTFIDLFKYIQLGLVGLRATMMLYADQ